MENTDLKIRKESTGRPPIAEELKLVNVNLKITRQQRAWLESFGNMSEKAREVFDKEMSIQPCKT